MATALQRGEDPSQAVAAVREKNLALQRERSWILEAGDFDDGYLDDTPVCAKCGGRGYVGAQMCSCLRELCRQEQKKELTSLLGSGRETFAPRKPEQRRASAYQQHDAALSPLAQEAVARMLAEEDD